MQVNLKLARIEPEEENQSFRGLAAIINRDIDELEKLIWDEYGSAPSQNYTPGKKPQNPKPLASK